jgi:hypothetical protein
MGFSLFRYWNPDIQIDVSSRPERTRISCHAALDKATCAPFRKEGRMNCTNATKFHRKSGVAQWRDLLFLFYSAAVRVYHALGFRVWLAGAKARMIKIEWIR